jgi:hypothetical protein
MTTTSERYPVRVEVDYQGRMGRLSTFFRYILLIPHGIVLGLLGVAVSVVVSILWFVIVITGRCPRGMHGFVAGYLRWSTRVNAYSLLLTDRFPPFSTN